MFIFQLWQLFLDQIRILGVGGNENVFCWYYLAVSVESLLQKRLSDSEEIEKLFRFAFAAIWPKTTSDAASHNYTIVVAVSHDRLGFKVSAKLGFFFVLKRIIVINDVIRTFFEEK